MSDDNDALHQGEPYGHVAERLQFPTDGVKNAYMYGRIVA